MKKLFLLFLFFFFQHLKAQETAKDAKDLTFKTGCSDKNEKIILSFVGDILIHKPLYQSVINGTKHFNQIWKSTIPLIEKADFSIGNLEGPTALGVDHNGHDHGDVGFIYDDFIYSGTNLIFNYHPRLLSDLKDSGFDLLTASNNHVMDRGTLGIDKTILAARAINLPLIGTRKSDEEKGDYFKVLAIKKMQIAFIGCTEFTNDADIKNQVFHCEDPKLLTLIKTLSAFISIDAIVVLPHWGIEYSTTPKAYQKEYARKFLEAGASVIVGSHPHVLQPWEKYTTTSGREGFIAYSLGNFVARQGGLEKQTGAIVYVGFSKNENQKANLFGVAYTPTYRQENQISPVGNNGNSDVLKLTAELFGKKRRSDINSTLSTIMCAP